MKTALDTTSIDRLDYSNQILIKDREIKITITRTLHGNDLMSLVDSNTMSERALVDFVLNLIQYAEVKIEVSE